jgi:metal-sulfur cluster biosynthetic enzyme
MSQAPFPYAGDPELRLPIENALRGVIDPEMSLNIVELGLVYGVRVEADAVHVSVTMTSAACPVAELIVDDIGQGLRDVLGAERDVRVDLCWEPPWTPERMSAKARFAMGWD